MYDIVVLGGGPAGYTAAVRASQLGKKVALIEQKFLGGTCMNEGCIPTKALLKVADLIQETKSREFGFIGEGSVAHSFALDRKNKIVKNSRMGLSQLMKKNNIDVFEGIGEVIDNETLMVKKEGEEQELKFGKLILATGSSSAIPTFIKGYDNEGVIDSSKALDLEEIPESLVIIGGGVIGLELASYFVTFGTKVTILEYQPNLLPLMDSDIGEQALRVLKKQGIKSILSAKVLSIEKVEDKLVVKYELNDKLEQVEANYVLSATGRHPNLCGLGKLQIETERGAIKVNENLETSIKNIYACGDNIGGKMLAHLAYAEGRKAAEIAALGHSEMSVDPCPACVYTNPEIATVGYSENELKKLNIEYRVGRVDLRTNGRCQTLGVRDGFIKIMVNSKDEIIGAAIMGANASEMIGELTVAVKEKLTCSKLADTIHPHPSVSECIWEVCNQLCNKPIHG